MRFIPVLVDPDEPEDNHLVEHVEEIALGLPCECASVGFTESGLIVVTEADPMAPVDLNPEQEDGYDPRGPYL